MYQTTMYRHIFGLEEGWIVYKDVTFLERVISRADPVKQNSYRTLCFGELEFFHSFAFSVPFALEADPYPSVEFIVAGIVLAGICSYVAVFKGLGTNVGMTCYVLAIVCGTLSVVGVIAWSVPDVPDEAAVEANLRNHYWSWAVRRDGPNRLDQRS